MANNANTQAVRKDVSTLRAEIATLRNMLQNWGSSTASNATATWGGATTTASPTAYSCTSNPFCSSAISATVCSATKIRTPVPSTGSKRHYSPIPINTLHSEGGECTAMPTSSSRRNSPVSRRKWDGTLNLPTPSPTRKRKGGGRGRGSKRCAQQERKRLCSSTARRRTGRSASWC